MTIKFCTTIFLIFTVIFLLFHILRSFAIALWVISILLRIFGCSHLNLLAVNQDLVCLSTKLMTSGGLYTAQRRSIEQRSEYETGKELHQEHLPRMAGDLINQDREMMLKMVADLITGHYRLEKHAKHRPDRRGALHALSRGGVQNKLYVNAKT